MSSFKKVAKSGQKTHRERSQLSVRKHLGLLEKKKDYRLRARDYHKKQNYLKVLKKKALDKNPEEFYFKMINSKLKDGIHVIKNKEEPVTEEQKKLMQAQDIKYVNYKRMVEAKKIEKLKSNLHMLDDSTEKPKNKHLFFVDSEKEVKEFDAAKRLDTLPELLPRTYNRPTKKTLQTARLLGQTDADSIRYLANERRRQYKELTSRIEREKELHIVSQKMEVLKNLMDKTQKIKKKEETKTTPAVYKWVAQRKR